MQTDRELPVWLRSPPTPTNPEHVEPGPDGAPPRPPVAVVESGGCLWDRHACYAPHRYALAVPDEAGAVLITVLQMWWSRHDTDERPQNAAVRQTIQQLAHAAAGSRLSRALERRRAWRLVDWDLRVATPAFLDLAGFGERADRIRALPPLRRPDLPPGATGVLRAASREADEASTAALEGRRPYRRRVGKATGEDRASSAHRCAWHGLPSLEYVARELFPSIKEATRSYPKPTALSRGLEAGGHARICIEHDPRIADEEIAATSAKLHDAALDLVRELIAMGKN
jgi:hypothetical protein